VAVTGSSGRLGRALVAALGAATLAEPDGPVPWTRAEFDLDAPDGIGDLLDRSAVELVVHAAAWTDVDACALDPALAMRRNAGATAALAGACSTRGVDLIVISTNEVFDGARNGGAYQPGDPPAPANPYGASKLAAERAATHAYGAHGARGVLGIARTAWLFGPGKPDFPTKIIAAAERAAASDEPLRVVGDEIGTPSYTPDIADAIVELLGERAFAEISHLVNAGTVSRAGWARDVLDRVGLTVPVVEVSMAEFPRPSRPPRWGVLAATALPSGRVPRDWHEAMADYAPTLRQAVEAIR
jgi:dTDP-4-dehydrorhamnose reductase